MIDQEPRSEFWMRPGNHTVTIVDYMTDKHRSGQEFVQFTYESSDGRIAHHRIVLNENTGGLLMTLAGAARAKRFRASEPDWDLFVGKDLSIEVGLNEKSYPVVKRWHAAPRPDGEMKMQTLAEAKAQESNRDEDSGNVDDLMELLGI